MRNSGAGGFTLVELTLSAGILAMASLWALNWLRQPSILLQSFLGSDQQTQAMMATNNFVKDLTEADPNSIMWNSVFPNSNAAANLCTFSFYKSYYDLSNGGTRTQVSYQYTVQSTASGNALLRVVNGSSTTVLSPVIAPSSAFPLVQLDTSPTIPTNSILVLTIQYQPLGTSQPINVVRRVALKS
jgi:hypothetical protein